MNDSFASDCFIRCLSPSTTGTDLSALKWFHAIISNKLVAFFSAVLALRQKWLITLFTGIERNWIEWSTQCDTSHESAGACKWCDCHNQLRFRARNLFSAMPWNSIWWWRQCRDVEWAFWRLHTSSLIIVISIKCNQYYCRCVRAIYDAKQLFSIENGFGWYLSFEIIDDTKLMPFI